MWRKSKKVEDNIWKELVHTFSSTFPVYSIFSSVLFFNLPQSTKLQAMAEALQDIPEHQTEHTIKSTPTESVSFGRFAGDYSLYRDKWSALSQNKYMEEIGKCSTPGSVAEKKAYFEAHYKRFAAQSMDLFAQYEQTDAGHPNSEEQNFHSSWGNSEVSDSTNADVEQFINGNSDSIDADETSRFIGESKEELCTKPDFPEAKELETNMDTTEPKLEALEEALESKVNEGVNESENLEAMVDEAESLESKVDRIGNQTDVSSNKVAILELEEVGKEADASEPQKDELGSEPETSTLQMQGMRGKTVILEAEVDEIAAKPSEGKVTEASGLADVCESMLDGVGSKISEPMVDDMGIQPDCSVSNVDVVGRDDENFTESQASDKMSQQLDKKSNKSPVPKLDGVRHSPMNKLSKKKACTSKQTDSNAKKKREAVTPASPKPKLQNHSTPKSSKVTPASPLTPASKFTQRKDSCSLSSENKRTSPTFLDSRNLRSVNVDSASPPTNRRDLIMEKMGDKEIVQKAFKTFRNSLNLFSSSDDAERPSVHQQAVMKGKQQPDSLEKTQLQRKQPSMTSGSLNEARGSKKVTKAASLSLELRRDDEVEKQKDLPSALKKRSNNTLGSHSDCI